MGEAIGVVGSRIAQMLSQEIAQLQHSRKFTEKVDSTKARETPMITGDA